MNHCGDPLYASMIRIEDSISAMCCSWRTIMETVYIHQGSEPIRSSEGYLSATTFFYRHMYGRNTWSNYLQSSWNLKMLFILFSGSIIWNTDFSWEPITKSLLFKINFFMHKWKVLLKGDEQAKLSSLEGSWELGWSCLWTSCATDLRSTTSLD